MASNIHPPNKTGAWMGTSELPRRCPGSPAAGWRARPGRDPHGRAPPPRPPPRSPRRAMRTHPWIPGLYARLFHGVPGRGAWGPGPPPPLSAAARLPDSR